MHEHLNREHYKCHVCEKQGLPNQFFKDYQQLCIHFDREHFLCQDPQCIAARFVVFENEIDLRAHELSVHGSSLNNSKKSAKVQVQFRIHRSGYDGSGIIEQQVPSEEDFQYGLDGEVFVPEALPTTTQQQNEPEISHPLHAARTAELRAQAQAIREQQRLGEEVEAFPALRTTSVPDALQQQPFVGWTTNSKVRRALRGGAPNVEDFPALSSKSKPVGFNPASSALTTGSSQSGNGWATSSSGGTNRRKVVPPSSARSSSSAASATSIKETNNVLLPPSIAPSLTSEHFPSLGRSTTGMTNSTSRYTAAVALGKKIAEKSSFSAGNATKPISMPISSKQQAKIPSSAPSLNSNDFPSLGSPSTASNATRYSAAMAFGRKIADGTHYSSKAHSSLVPNSISATMTSNANSTLSSKEQLDNIKLILGPDKYKRLKSLTKDFANSELRPQEFVNLAASLFDLGVKDANFISFLPNLINSCPPSANTERALSYLNSQVNQRQVNSNPSTTAENNSALNFSVLQPSSQSHNTNIAAVSTKKKSSATVSSSAWGKN